MQTQAPSAWMAYRTCQNEAWKTVSGQCSLFYSTVHQSYPVHQFLFFFLWIDFTNLFQEFFAQHVSNGQRNQKSAYRKYKILHALFDPSEYSDVRQIFYAIGAILLFPCTARKLFTPRHLSSFFHGVSAPVRRLQEKRLPC